MIETLFVLSLFFAGGYAGMISERAIWKRWLKKNYPKVYEENGGDRAY